MNDEKPKGKKWQKSKMSKGKNMNDEKPKGEKNDKSRKCQRGKIWTTKKTLFPTDVLSKVNYLYWRLNIPNPNSSGIIHSVVVLKRQ